MGSFEYSLVGCVSIKVAAVDRCKEYVRTYVRTVRNIICICNLQAGTYSMRIGHL